jgi:hypothetical protein
MAGLFYLQANGKLIASLAALKELYAKECLC